MLLVNGTILDTDDSDDTTITLSAGTPGGSVLLGDAESQFGANVTNSNTDARFATVVILASDGGAVQFRTTEDLSQGYYERYIYSSEATVLRGIDEDGVEFDDVSLSVGWNVVIGAVTDTGEVFTTTTPDTGGAWVLIPFGT